MLKFLIPATLAALLPASAALASPATSSADFFSPTAGSIELVQLRHEKKAAPHREMRHGPAMKNRNGRNQRFTPGGRYRSAPSGWRRYGARPGDWRTRGCVQVGPLWFCP
ncbi:hypothetical protein [Hansschlegelia plantiphila]|uniref:hypothetical protein n=1 Tax=Hansschlegelia plantiphila TaxID=374655 RepID=UPI0022F2580F|nr:hypothetical protein [Hansschlegelia plantiphila]